jgi:hypothetical protein
MGRAIVRYALVSASSALLNAAGVAALLFIQSRLFIVPYQLIWWLVRGLVFALFNYPLHREFVFAHRSE